MLESNFLKKFDLIKHGIFSPKEGIKAMEDYFATEKIALLKQVHGDTVFDATLTNFLTVPDADASITSDKGLVLTIKTADCSPIIFYNYDKNMIAVAHAGWRGALKGVIAATVKKIGTKGTVALIGPMIYKDNYEVKSDLMENFSDKRFFMSKDKRFYFDFPGFIKSRLEESGIEDFEFMRIDTYSHHKELASYRYNSLHNIKPTNHLYTAVMLKE